MWEKVGNGYGRSAVQPITWRIFPANSYRVTFSPELSALWKCILRNGHNRSLQNSRIPYAARRGDSRIARGFLEKIHRSKAKTVLIDGWDGTQAVPYDVQLGTSQQPADYHCHCEEGEARRTPGWPLLPFGQFTFWQSPGRQYRNATFHQEIPTLRSE